MNIIIEYQDITQETVTYRYTVYRVDRDSAKNMIFKSLVSKQSVYVA